MSVLNGCAMVDADEPTRWNGGDMDTVRWGIVGAGDVVLRKSGGPFDRVPGASLTAVMRRDAGKAKEAAEALGATRWYADASQLIADPEVDAVYVATPPSSHRQLAIQCAEAGKPVLVEKPMARTHGECVEMVAACRRAGVPLFVAYYRRAMAKYRRIKAMIDDGTIGDVRLVTYVQRRPLNQPKPDDWRTRPETSGGGYFVDMGSHVLDLMEYLFGPVTEASGVACRMAGAYAAEDTVTASLLLGGRVPMSGNWCFAAPDTAEECRIFGSDGTLSFAILEVGEPVRLERSGAMVSEEPFAAPEWVHEPFVANVTDALLGKADAVCTGESGARTARVVDAILHGLPMAG